VSSRVDGKIVNVPLFGGGEAPGLEVQFEPTREPWCEYKLLDGGSVKIRATAVKIYRVVDAQGKPTYQPDGQPAVVVSNQIQIVSSD